jgi:predicted transcriptional regulator
MTPAEHVQQVLDRRRAEEKAEFRQDHERLARERDGMTCDAYIARWDDPDRKPMIA